MNYEIKNEPNYAAQIITVPAPHKMPNSDKLYGITVFGITSIVDASWIEREGQLAVYFPPEVQLAENFVWANNLFRHGDLNANPAESGYIEDNRRVRSIKLRGNVSAGLILPIQSLTDAGYDVSDLLDGTRFDTIGGVEICRKYRVKGHVPGDKNAIKIKRAFKRVDAVMMPEHIETDQWLRNEHDVSDSEMLVITQKLHGTSGRFARTLVKRRLTWLERALIKLGVNIKETEYDTVAGSRKVIKDVNNPEQKHFYGEGGDVWSQYLPKVSHLIPEGFIIYGEIIGWINEKPIQAGHTYDLPKGENMLYVYRVATISPEGLLVDLSWDQVVGFCRQRGLKVVPELWRGKKENFDLSWFEEKAFADNPYELLQRYPLDQVPHIPVRLSEGGTGKDEGIAIRADRGGSVPDLWKFKNPSHYEYETKQLDSGEEDMESAES